MQGHQKNSKKNKNNVEVVHLSSNMVTVVVIIYCYIGCKDKDKTPTLYLNGFPEGSNLGSTV